MAGQIRISPEQMRTRAGDFRTEGQNFEGVITKMGQLITALQGEWEGQASHEFGEQFTQLKPSFDKVKDLIDDIGKQLDGTADAMERMDEEIAGKFKI